MTGIRECRWSKSISNRKPAKMDYLKFVQLGLTFLLALVALSAAQDYVNYDDYDGRIVNIPVRRIRRQGGVEAPRVRRQGGGGEGVTGPVHTFVKTDEHAHFKWGVRHHVGHEYSG